MKEAPENESNGNFCYVEHQESRLEIDSGETELPMSKHVVQGFSSCGPYVAHVWFCNVLHYVIKSIYPIPENCFVDVTIWQYLLLRAAVQLNVCFLLMNSWSDACKLHQWKLSLILKDKWSKSSVKYLMTDFIRKKLFNKWTCLQ
jgi:hypothetical protein